MTVYIDNACKRYGRMIMCHMLADEEGELHRMAQSVGVAQRHFQRDHYDVCLKSKAAALKRGAVEISQRNAVLIRRQFRTRHPLS